jgi:hypothetical protein
MLLRDLQVDQLCRDHTSFDQTQSWPSSLTSEVDLDAAANRAVDFDMIVDPIYTALNEYFGREWVNSKAARDIVEDIAPTMLIDFATDYIVEFGESPIILGVFTSIAKHLMQQGWIVREARLPVEDVFRYMCCKASQFAAPQMPKAEIIAEASLSGVLPSGQPFKPPSRIRTGRETRDRSWGGVQVYNVKSLGRMQVPLYEPTFIYVESGSGKSHFVLNKGGSRALTRFSKVVHGSWRSTYSDITRSRCEDALGAPHLVENVD